eukprot:Skav228431  [mRNA]  locus=scaffold1325:416500:425994:- [translate_table: standard]
MERAKSEPRSMVNVNPFYSDRLKEELVVRASRPKVLPPDGESSEDFQPIADVAGNGKGRGEVAATMMNSGASGSGGNFVTPPSKSQWRRAVGGPREHGRQTEGCMPPESHDVVKSMGTIPSKTAGESTVVDDTSQPSRVSDDLQRALEREMVNQLHEQNVQLKAEIEQLKKQQGTTPGSMGSWSEVTAVGSHGHSATFRDDRGADGSSPKMKRVSLPPEARYTPGGTRVPDGEPPDEVGADRVPPCPPPEVPPMPIMDDGWNEGYESTHDDRKVRRIGMAWKPMTATHGRTVSPEDARRFWLEKEVQYLQRKLDAMSHPPSSMSRSAYWTVPFQGSGDPSGRSARETRQSLLDAAASLGATSDPADRDGAMAVQDDHHGHARAPIADHGGECRHATEYRSDRACDAARDGRAQSDRANDVARDGRGPSDRADEPARDGQVDGSRAAMSDLGGECHRASVRGDTRASMIGRGGDDSRSRTRDDVRRDLLHEQKLEEYRQAVGGKGYGHADLPATHPASAWWEPPEGGGETIEVVDDRGRRLPSPHFHSPLEMRGGRPAQSPPLAPYAPIPSSWGESNTGGGSRAELPSLPASSTPLQFGDWLHLCGPVMRDISGNANQWWEATTRQALVYYNEWKGASPLQRIQIEPKLPSTLEQPQFGRTEQRGVHLLLRAVADDIQQMLVTDRQLSSTAILFKLYIRYQPGGPGEKAIILKELTTLPKATTIAEVAGALRGWRRHFGRAREVEASLPDGVLLLKALEGACQFIAKMDSQAAFRLAQSRSQLQVDEQPVVTSIWAYSQCLLAEAETLVLMSSSTTSASGDATIKVRQLDGAGDPPPSKAGDKATEDNAAGKGKGNNVPTTEIPCKWFRSDQGCRAGKQCRWSHSWEGVADKASRCWTCGSKEHRKNDCKLRGGKARSGDGSSVGDASGGTGEHGSKGSNSSIATALLQEATTLLKAMRGPQHQPNISAIRLAKLDMTEKEWILLDSGATHALRPSLSDLEWQQATPTEVVLADGSTTQFRLKPGTRILLTPYGQPMDAWIVPMGGVAEIGYSIEWRDGKCVVKDDGGREIPVSVRNGCPMFSKDQGQMIVHKLEARQLHLRQKQLIIQKMIQHPELRPEKWTAEVALTMKLRHLWPQLPESLAMAVIPDLETYDDGSLGQKVPWNRRTRRRLESAKNLILHLYAGKDGKFWATHLGDSNTEVLCVDILDNHKANVLDGATFTYLVRLVMTGRVRAIIGGPPCRTVSALRFQDGGGPRIVRDEQHPSGRPTNTEQEDQLVEQDSILWLRMLALYVLAEEIRGDHSMVPTAFVVEQPEDPRNYRDEKEVRERGFMSMWRTSEWLAFQKEYDMKLISFDQGCMGHQKRKPTSLGTNIPELFDLNEMRGGGQHQNLPGVQLSRQNQTMREKCEESKRWAEWAPGLKRALAFVLRRWVDGFQLNSPKGCIKRLKLLTRAQWKAHFENDHLPARRDCRHCVQAQARSKPHRRVRHAEAFTLALDLTGKMTPGEDQCTKGSRKVSYMMVATYTFPTSRTGEPIIPPPGTSEPEDHQLPPLDADLEGSGAEGDESCEHHDEQDASSSLTHTAYYVKSTETGNFFYTDDVVTVDPRTVPGGEAIEAARDPPAEDVPFLMVRGDAVPPMPWRDAPPRRIRGKTTMPDFAMHRIAGEQDEGGGGSSDADGFFFVPEPHESVLSLETWNMVDDLDALSDREGCSHSWTLETAPSSSTTSLRSLVEEDIGGGEKEGDAGSGDQLKVDTTQLNRVLALLIASLMIQESMADSGEEEGPAYVFYGGVFVMMCGVVSIVYVMSRIGLLGIRYLLGLSDSSSLNDGKCSATSSKAKPPSGLQDECATSESSSSRSGAANGRVRVRMSSQSGVSASASRNRMTRPSGATGSEAASLKLSEGSKTSQCSKDTQIQAAMQRTTALDLVQGITEYSSRIALKMLFTQFGEVRRGPQGSAVLSGEADSSSP